MMFWRLLPTSHRILLALSIFYFVNAVALHGSLTSWLALIPSEAVGRWQYWRFFTYPFALYGWSFLPVSIVLYFFAPEVEELLSGRKLLLSILLFTTIHSVIYTPLMLMANAPLAGPQAIALMILTMYLYLYPSGEASLFGVIPLRASILLALMISIAFISPLLFPPFHAIDFIHVFADELFGVFAGLLFSYLYFGRSNDDESPLSFLSKKDHSQQPATQRRPTPSTAPVGFASLQSSASEKPSSATILSDAVYEDADEFGEERLNEILDKINEKGQASLTNAERKFLQDYAKRL